MELEDLNISRQNMAWMQQLFMERYAALNLPDNTTITDRNSNFWHKHKNSRTSESTNCEMLFRGTSIYAANTVMEILSKPEGKELHEKLYDVATGKSNGILISGLPTNLEATGLFILGLATLLGSHPYYANDFAPIITSIFPRNSCLDHHSFHQDIYSDEPSSSNLVFLGSGQEHEMAAGTCFKLADADDTPNAEHKLKPGEVILFNDKTLKHSTGVLHWGSRQEERRLIRLLVECTTFSQPIQQSDYLQGILSKGGFLQTDYPTSQGEWINRVANETNHSQPNTRSNPKL
ncbi:MAG: hypothetical protein COV36_07285 [Alphaproteobacteria bacterium CG11_big_fil_rev_8_21_14_0_20_44_7]|nr:MAG: hypothetical protein COV36_07285 [Alphaproteobacteria bacterium CG11_big_fil_rev_8_21_14_0_20_44_7]